MVVYTHPFPADKAVLTREGALQGGKNMLEFLTSNADELFLIIGLVVSTATAIVALTPSTRDDKILGKIVKFIELVSVVNKKTK